MLLFIAIVLDPRYKMRYVNFILGKTYDSLLEKLKADYVEDNIGGETNMMDVVDDILHSEWEKHLEEEKVEKKI
uniref:hAT-like transposase RNase-H fold domain-containing protein n=1 Tax=Solanum lycopersicum TaxID=4081 RepID=A0A3Q7G677_SOLLC